MIKAMMVMIVIFVPRPKAVVADLFFCKETINPGLAMPVLKNQGLSAS